MCLRWPLANRLGFVLLVLATIGVKLLIFSMTQLLLHFMHPTHDTLDGVVTFEVLLNLS